MLTTVLGSAAAAVERCTAIEKELYDSQVGQAVAWCVHCTCILLASLVGSTVSAMLGSGSVGCVGCSDCWLRCLTDIVKVCAVVCV